MVVLLHFQHQVTGPKAGFASNFNASKRKKKKKRPQRKTEKHIKKRDAARIPGQQKTEEKTDRDD